MRLDKLSIKKFKNLQNFQVDFDEKQLTTVLIGRNGTGKSNLIEALVIIFRNLDLVKMPSFYFSIIYECRGFIISITTNDDGNKYDEFIVDNNKLTQKDFFEKKEDFLPNHVFAYYSGPSNRLEKHFDEHQKKFYKALLNGDDKPLRSLFYARMIHSQFVLLSFFSFDNPDDNEFLLKYFGIIGLESVLFEIRQPNWGKNERNNNKRFWGAKGVVADFIKTLYSIALAPMFLNRNEKSGFNNHNSEHLFLYLRDITALKTLANNYDNPRDFFKVLESTYISEMLYNVYIRVKTNNGSITFRELSEGEQQLITVLGLLRFTKDDESLFLLDEPDTHLNPAWKLEYLDLLGKVVGKSTSSHILLCTHDPLVIGGLLKSQVQIFYRELSDGMTKVTHPHIDPKGMGVEGLLTSELFGLSTTVDIDTQNKVNEKRKLFLRSLSDGLSATEMNRMRILSEELGSLDFSRTTRDPLYNRFISALMSRPEYEISLTPENFDEQKRIANEIIDEILKEEKNKR